MKDVATPVELGKLYSDSGADEIAFYDITASGEGRLLSADILRQVAAQVSVPLTAGGGISSLADFDMALECGASKVSVNSGALKNPGLIREAADKHGSRCVVVSADVKRVGDAYRVFAKGGMEDTGLDAVEWLKRCEGLGAGEFVINSIDADGAKSGYDIPMLELFCGAVSIPIIASGGAGSIADFVNLFKALPQIDAGLAASIFHFGDVKIPDLKRTLHENGIRVKL